MFKFSIVIPTRARADTLIHALTTAVEQTFSDIEIIVHESGDDPHTAGAVAAVGDSRTRHVKTGHPVSMTKNWELALNSATGDYITFLGDDDGLTNDACAVASSILEREPAELLSWRPLAYYWPLYVVEARRNRLEGAIGPAVVERKSSALILELFYRFREDYSHLPMVYNSFVKRTVIERVRDKMGCYFVGGAPDICSGIVNAFCSESFLLSGRPLSVSGLSHNSTGHRIYFSKDRVKRDEAARDAFDTLRLHPSLVQSNNLKLFIGNEMLIVKESLFPEEEPGFRITDLLDATAQALQFGPDDYDESLSDIREVAALNGIDIGDLAIPPRHDGALSPPQGVRALGPDALLIDIDCTQAGVENVRDAARLLQALMPLAGEQPVIVTGEVVRTLPSLNGEGFRVDFTHTGNGVFFLGSGWGESEPWGTWTIASRAAIRMRTERRDDKPFKIDIRGQMFISGPMQNPRGSVRLNGGVSVPFAATSEQPNVVIHLVASPEVALDREIVLEFEIERPVSPAEEGIGLDTRRLGFGLKAIEFAMKTGDAQ